MIVYGSRISYYTGKLEAYFRYKNILHTSLPMPYGDTKMLKEKVGVVQMPIVDDDGKWMSDTTPIIMHLETEHPANPVLPQDPVVGFISHLIEDYGDEWLWRPAMYYRWWYNYDRQLASNILTDEVMGHIKLPRWVKLKMIARRQAGHFVKRDGVTETTRHHIEQSYHNALAAMTAMLENRPFLLGNAPSLADFGMMGPMFRHYGQDPTPQEIMRNTAPAVFEWVARMWHAKNQVQPEFVIRIPDDAAPLLKEICETHLVQLTANAEAFADKKERFDMTVQGCDYRDIAVSKYRVWCLEELRRRFDSLSVDQQKSVKAVLPHNEAEVLWNAKPSAQSGFNSDNHLPFGRAINVFKGGVP